MVDASRGCLCVTTTLLRSVRGRHRLHVALVLAEIGSNKVTVGARALLTGFGAWLGLGRTNAERRERNSTTAEGQYGCRRPRRHVQRCILVGSGLHCHLSQLSLVHLGQTALDFAFLQVGDECRA
eukprot:COSAG01_NODE_7896_length_3001_cov_13.892833_3_plen_125_part_00